MKKIWMMGAALAVMLAVPAAAQEGAQTVHLCTGGEGGVYHRTGVMIAEFADSNKVVIDVINTAGTFENMDKTLAGQCDAFIGQPDGPAYLARTKPGEASKISKVMDLGAEYAHAICNKESGVDDLDELSTENKIAIGAPGSGAWLLWQNWIAEDDSYAEIPTTTDSGTIALTAVASGETTCMLVPSGTPSPVVMDADAQFGDAVILASVTDKDFNDAKTADGKPLYAWADLPTKAYPNTFNNYWGDIETVRWNAGLYVNKARLQGKSLEAFLKAAMRARPNVLSAFGK